MKKLLLTAFCGLSSHAGAVVLFTDIPDTIVQGFGGDRSLAVDLDGDGFNDYVIRSNDSPGDAFVIIPEGSNRVFTTREMPPNIGTFAINFSEGQTIYRSILSEMIVLTPRSERFDGRPLGPVLDACVAVGGGVSCLGQFPGGSPGFVGLEFESDGELHYGYIHASGGGLNGGSVFSWAYETDPNMAILAGAIPEPSSVFLSCIGAIALMRRRR